MKLKNIPPGIPFTAPGMTVLIRVGNEPMLSANCVVELGTGRCEHVLKFAGDHWATRVDYVPADVTFRKQLPIDTGIEPHERSHYDKLFAEVD